jgi:nicotinate-nucleotide adenylyltransferase
MMKKKVLLFGGSFDPIHNGHTIVACHAVEHVGADELVFIPAHRSPHKQLFPGASAFERLVMIELAIAGEKMMCVSDCEINRDPPSYTIDTAHFFRGLYGDDAELCWLVGGDVLEDLPRWYRIRELLDECTVCLMLRPGFDTLQLDRFSDVFGQEQVEKLKRNIILNPLIDISSTEIRRRVEAGEDISKMVHPAVAAYIKEHSLYVEPGNRI